MNKKLLISMFLCFVILPIFLIFQSCATLTTRRIPTLTFSEYALEAGSEELQRKSDIEINLEVVRLSNVYNYPRLFSFKLANLPARYADNPTLRSEYRPGPVGRQWEFPFTSPDGKLQLLLCFCKIKNNTKHILRMRDARIYLIIEGVEPLPAISSFDELLKQADYFENVTNRQRAREVVLLVLQKSPLPEGFFRSIVLYNKRNYKLINDINAEILPGFSYEGILVFPIIPSFSPQAKISFFDVTTRVDAAGNPIEKTLFDFNLKRHYIQMWYDRSENAWKVGPPPEIK